MAATGATGMLDWEVMLLAMLCSAHAEETASWTCWTALQQTMQMRCNGGTRGQGAGVGMACFIVASVERRAAFPVVPCSRLARLMEYRWHMQRLRWTSQRVVVRHCGVPGLVQKPGNSTWWLRCHGLVEG